MAIITTPIPDVESTKSVYEKIQMLTDSYYQLRKEIEYGMQNIDTENFSTSLNQTLTDEFGNVAELIATAEVFSVRMANAEGNISSLTTNAEAIELKVADNEDNISSLIVTADGLSTRVSTAEGNISSVIQTADALGTRLTDAEGNISTITQTVDSLSSRISDAEGDISTIEQTSSSLTTRIENAEGDISTIEQTTSGITAAVDNSKLVFDSSGLTVKNGGFKIMEGSSTVASISSSGILELFGGKLKIYNSSANYEMQTADSYGNIVIRNLYVNGFERSLSSSLLSGESYSIFYAAGDTVKVGADTYYYKYEKAGTYNHYFTGDIWLARSSYDSVYILGRKVKWDSNGFLVEDD
jgi:hypothetical protein